MRITPWRTAGPPETVNRNTSVVSVEKTVSITGAGAC
jgi:hypothetical protein